MESVSTMRASVAPLGGPQSAQARSNSKRVTAVMPKPAHRQASTDMVLFPARRPSMMRQAPWVSPPVTTMSISDS